MPKVNSDYLEKKKTEILDAAYRVFQQKPLYEMTMLDVIKEADLSKGGIYRYYSDIDEVMIALINRETAQNNYKDQVDEIVENTSSIKEVIEKLLTFLGKYIHESPATLGKIQFELTVFLSNHPEKIEKFTGSLTEQESGQYLMGVLFGKIMEGLGNGELVATYPPKDIFSYVIATIEGVVNQVVMERCYGTVAEPLDVIQVFKLITSSVLNMLTGTTKI